MSVVVYHYTSVEGLDAIERSGFIMESKRSVADAVLGDGVYLTQLSPEEGRRRIAQNNWGGLWEVMENNGKVERAIKLWIPRGKLISCNCDRDVLLHKGRLYLKDYKYETVRLDQGGTGNKLWDSVCAIL